MRYEEAHDRVSFAFYQLTPITIFRQVINKQGKACKHLGKHILPFYSGFLAAVAPFLVECTTVQIPYGHPRAYFF
jgi:hypothetical protein